MSQDNQSPAVIKKSKLQESAADTIFMRRYYKKQLNKQSERQELPNTQAATPFDIALQHIFWKRATIFGLYRNYWVIHPVR